MNKKELVDAIAKKANVTKKDADKILSTFLKVIMDAVADGQKVVLVGFGTFEPRNRKARQRRNPQTGDRIETPATVMPIFFKGKIFKAKVAKN